MTKEPRDFWWMPFLKTGQKFSCNFHFGVSTGIIISVWQWAISRSGSQVEWVLSSTIAQAIKQCRGGFVTTSSHWCWGLRCHVCWHLWNGMLVWNHLASQAVCVSVWATIPFLIYRQSRWRPRPNLSSASWMLRWMWKDLFPRQTWRNIWCLRVLLLTYHLHVYRGKTWARVNVVELTLL